MPCRNLTAGPTTSAGWRNRNAGAVARTAAVIPRRARPEPVFGSDFSPAGSSFPLLTAKAGHLNRARRSPIPGIGKVQRGGRSLGAPCIHVAQMEDMAMRDFDLTPVRRSTIGFDRLFDLIDDSFRLQGEDNYPPYNIARVGEDHYRISLALAGFKPEEITVTAAQNMLTVEGRKAENGDHEYLFQGISGRPFRRKFNLADYVEVTCASFENGLLHRRL